MVLKRNWTAFVTIQERLRFPGAVWPGVPEMFGIRPSFGKPFETQGKRGNGKQMLLCSEALLDERYPRRIVRWCGRRELNPHGLSATRS